MVPLLRRSALPATCVILLLVTDTAIAQSRVDVESAKDVFDCVSRNAPTRSAHQSFALEVYDRSGGMQKLEAELHWKRDADRHSKILIEVSAPPDLRGSSYLLIEGDDHTDMFAYLPELKLVRRVTGRHSAGSVFGSDFSYEDMQRLYNVARQGASKRLQDETLDGRAVWVVETRPASDTSSAYRKTVTRVDQQTCVALETVFYDTESEVRKTLRADASRLERVDGIWVPMRVRIEDRKTSTHTILEVETIAFGGEMSDALFTRSSLERRGR